MERWKLNMEVAVKEAALMLLCNRIYISAAKRAEGDVIIEGVTDKTWYLPQKTLKPVLSTLRMYRDFLPRRARRAAITILSLEGVLSEKSIPEGGLNSVLWMRIQSAIMDLLTYR